MNKKWVLSHRFIDFDIARAKERHTIVHRFNERLQAGIEYNPGADEIGFIGNFMLAQETEKAPMVNLGTSSDRIGTPEGPKSYYVTFAKGFPKHKLGPYVTINYSEHDRGFNFPFGCSYTFQPGISAMFMNDGRKSHLLATYSKESWSVSLMWVWFKHPGISLSWGF